MTENRKAFKGWRPESDLTQRTHRHEPISVHGFEADKLEKCPANIQAEAQGLVDCGGGVI